MGLTINHRLDTQENRRIYMYLHIYIHTYIHIYTASWDSPTKAVLCRVCVHVPAHVHVMHVYGESLQQCEKDC